MRVDGVNNSPYTYQANMQSVSGNDTNRVGIPAEDPAACLELSHMVTEPEKKQSMEEPLSGKIKAQIQKDWKAFREWTKRVAEKTRQLWEKLVQKVVEMAAKLGNLWHGQDRRHTETGVPQVTWQENFRRRVRILFDAVNGFLSKHLPMNNGGFAETKEEKEKEDLNRGQDAKEEKKKPVQNGFDARG